MICVSRYSNILKIYDSAKKIVYFAKIILNVIVEESKLLSKFLKYISHSVAAMVGLSVHILADTFFISVHSGANGLAVLNLVASPFFMANYTFTAFARNDNAPSTAIVGSLMRGFVAIIILAIVLANMFGENGVWISFLGSEIITFITIILTDTLQKKKKTGVSL